MRKDIVNLLIIIESNEFNKYMSDKRKIVFGTYTEGDIIGLEDVIFKNKYLFSLQHVGFEGELYKIEQNVYFNKV